MNGDYGIFAIVAGVLIVGAGPILWKKLRVARGKRRSGRR